MTTKEPVHFIITIVLVLGACVALAAEPPEGTFTLGTVSVGASTLTDVQAIYRAAPSERTEAQDESDVRLCYSNLSPKGNAYLVFQSGPMGGYKTITTYLVTTRKPRGSCVQIGTDIESLATTNGLHLGISLEELKRVVPVRFKPQGNSWVYEAQTRRAMTADELSRSRKAWRGEQQADFDVTTRIRASFTGNHLIALRVERFDSF